MGCLSRSSAGLEVSLFAVGGCAELGLTASGADTDAVLVSVANTLRTALPKSARVRLCYASGRALHALRRAWRCRRSSLVVFCRAPRQPSHALAPSHGSRAPLLCKRDRHKSACYMGSDECVIVPCKYMQTPCSCCRVCTGHLYRLIALRRPVGQRHDSRGMVAARTLTTLSSRSTADSRESLSTSCGVRDCCIKCVEYPECATAVAWGVRIRYREWPVDYPPTVNRAARCIRGHGAPR